MIRSLFSLYLLFLPVAGYDAIVAAPPASPALIDDHAITVQGSADIEAKRRALIRYLWGPDGFPTRRMPDTVRTNVASPVHQLGNLARVDELHVDQMPGLQGLAYHFVPRRANGELVVVHHGHGCTLDDDPSPAEVGNGLQRTIAALLNEGYGVLGVFMPHMRPNDCSNGHDALCQAKVIGSPIKFFLETTAVGLNYVQSHSRLGRFPRYRSFHMVGLSGGGWTTTLYAALDQRIRCSFPVAGTTPLYLRSGGSIGDQEQYEASFYAIANYLDLYILGAHGKGRKQVQILNRRDDCCFGEAQYEAKGSGVSYTDAVLEYAQRVQATLERIGPGSFQLQIDEVAPSHMISHHAIEQFILPELPRARRPKVARILTPLAP